MRALLPLLLWCAPAVAAPNPYVTATVDEYLDGQRNEGSRVGGVMLEGIGGAGFRVIDPAGLEGLVEALKKGEIEGRYPQVDWILAVRIESDKLAEQVMQTGFVRYEAALEARVLAADTGEVVTVVNVKGQGMDLSPRTAARMASEQAVRQLVDELKAKTDEMLAKATRLRLRIAGVPDAAEAGRIAERLAGLSGVEAAEVRSYAKEATDVELRVAQVATAELARRIEAEKGLGLTVDGFSTRRLSARFAPERRVRISMLIGPFENGTGEAAEGWLSKEIAKVVELELGNHPAITARVGDLAALPKALQAVPARLGAAGADLDALLYVTGRYTYAGKSGAELLVKVFRVADGKPLATVEKKGDLEAFRKAIAAAAAEIAGESVAGVLAQPDLRQVAGIGAGEKSALEAYAKAADRRLEDVEVQPVLGGDRLRGTVSLRGGAGESAGLLVRGPKGSVTLDTPKLGAGTTGQVPLDLPLAALGVTEPGSNRVEVELTWRDAGAWRSERLVAPVMVFPEATAAR